tara:strand:- start:42 stop:1454 length:1413 start_codon:yes stop_codon:yes gene_type:complete
MARDDELKFAGEFRIDDCTIITHEGFEYNVNQLVEAVNFYEDIYSATVSGSIILKDTTNIVMNFPIIGQERLRLKIQTPQTNPTRETSIDFTNSPLYIHKINLQEGLNEGSQVVSLEFASSEGLRNQTTRISQSYSGQPSDIVEKILRDDSYLKSKKELTVEPTANNVKVVFPNYKPFRCIRHLLNISNSAVANSSPSYLFYETAAGFNFRTFDGLCKEPVKFYFRDNVAPVLNENKVIDVQINLETIVKYAIVTSKDTYRNLQNGMISSKLITHDVYNKRLDLYKYDYLSNFDTDIHPDEGGSPIIAAAEDLDTMKPITDSDAKLYVTSTASGYSFSEGSNYPYQSDNRNQTLQRKKSRKFQFESGVALNVEVPGQTAIHAGDKIRLEIGATTTLVQKDEDTQLTGNYIITQLRHNFNQSGDAKHSIIMRVAKDSKQGNAYGNSIQGVNSLYQDEGKSTVTPTTSEYYT